MPVLASRDPGIMEVYARFSLSGPRMGEGYARMLHPPTLGIYGSPILPVCTCPAIKPHDVVEGEPGFTLLTPGLEEGGLPG